MTTSRADGPRYPIRAVARLTGLGIDTLRAWERRHGAVTPVRDDRGRMYSEADVARLRLLHAAVRRGHSIGRVAALGDDELRRLAAADEPVVTPASPRAAADNAGLLTALQAYDAPAIDHELSRLAAVLRPLDLLQQVLMPVLTQVGDDWHQQRGAIAREHVMSAAVRNLLGSFLRLYAQPRVPARLVFATPAGERHELGTLGAAMLAASCGLGVVYLGPDVPAPDILDSVAAAAAQVLVLGVTDVASGRGRERAFRAQARELRTIVRDLPPRVELWVGGRGAELHASIVAPRGLIFLDYHLYFQQLQRLGGGRPGGGDLPSSDAPRVEPVSR